VESDREKRRTSKDWGQKRDCGVSGGTDNRAPIPPDLAQNHHPGKTKGGRGLKTLSSSLPEKLEEKKKLHSTRNQGTILGGNDKKTTYRESGNNIVAEVTLGGGRVTQPTITKQLKNSPRGKSWAAKEREKHLEGGLKEQQRTKERGETLNSKRGTRKRLCGQKWA